MNKKISILAVVFCSLLWSCEGPAGPQGTQGEPGKEGATGQTGAQGEEGEPGTSDVISTEWKTIPWSADDCIFRTSDSTLNLYTHPMGNSRVSFPLLTQEVLNTSAIFIYKRFYESSRNAKLHESYTRVVTSDNHVTGYFFKPGEGGISYRELGRAYLSHSTNFTAGSLVFSAKMDMRYSAYGINSREKVAQLLNTPKSELVASFNGAIQYRVVIVKGNVVSGRLKSVNWDDYNDVREKLDLKD